MKPKISSIFRFKKNVLLVFCLGFLLVIASLPSQADAALVTGVSNAYIDWTSLTFDNPSNFSWVADSQGNQSGIDLGLNDEHDPYNTNSLDGAFGTTSASNSVTGTDLSAGASASMTTTPISAIGSASASVNATGVGISDVFLANSVFTRDFEITDGGGTLTATADYWLSAHVTSDNVLSYVRADAFAGLYVYDFNQYGTFEAAEQAKHRTINGQITSLDLNNHGSLLLTIDLLPGTYTFEASAGTIEHLDSAVPIPSTLLLLGSGLFGLVGFRRRFNNPLN